MKTSERSKKAIEVQVDQVHQIFNHTSGHDQVISVCIDKDAVPVKIGQKVINLFKKFIEPVF